MDPGRDSRVASALGGGSNSRKPQWRILRDLTESIAFLASRVSGERKAEASTQGFRCKQNSSDVISHGNQVSMIRFVC